MKYINPIERKTIFNHGYVQIWDFSKANTTHQSRVQAVTTVSNSVFGDNGKIIDAQKLYERIKKEAAMETPGRPFQFIPIVLNHNDVTYKEITPEQVSNFYKYGHMKKHTIKQNIISHRQFIAFYSNYRNFLKFHKEQLQLQHLEPCKSFIVFKLKVPMFVRDQFMTHTGLSKINQSNRIGKDEQKEYYIPQNFLQLMISHLNDIYKEHNIIGYMQYLQKHQNCKTLDDYFKHFILDKSIDEGQELLKTIKMKKEIYSRFPNQLKYGIMWIAGWGLDPNAWYNLLLQRNAYPQKWSNWTQFETCEYAKVIKELIQKHHSHLELFK